MKRIKSTLIFLYRVLLMPFFERDNYYDELVNDVYENDIPDIIKKKQL